MAIPAVLADERYEPGISQAGSLDAILGASYQCEHLVILVANWNNQPAAWHQLAHQRLRHIG